LDRRFPLGKLTRINAPTRFGDYPSKTCSIREVICAAPHHHEKRALLRGCVEGEIMTSKHPKQKNPSDADLHRNPLIGGSKGTTMAHVTPEELEQLEGANTIEGDVENDTNPVGGIDKAKVRNARRGPPDHGREPSPHIAKSLHLSKNQAKGAGSGGMTGLQDEVIGENAVLSNRDKAEESGDRGQDGKWVKTEQLQDHAANKGRG
jgi:hypothetical protein